MAEEIKASLHKNPPTVATGATQYSTTQGKSILVVDDDDTIRYFFVADYSPALSGGGCSRSF